MSCLAKLKPGSMHNALVGPDGSNTVLMQIPGGIQFPVKRTFGPKDDGLSWYEIATPQGPGWLRSDALDLIGDDCPKAEQNDVALTIDKSTPPQVKAETLTVLGEKKLKIATINDDGVRVRDVPQVPSNVLHNGLRRGTEAEYIESSSDGSWHKIRLYDDRRTEGWATAEYIDVEEIVEKQVSRNLSTNPGEVILDVPYHSQEDATAKAAWADCGPTSLRMILGWNEVRNGRPDLDITVDDITKTVGIGPKEFSHFSMLIPAARHYGLEMYHTNQATLARIKRELDAGRPTLQLVHYGSYSQRMHKRFSAGHFMVVAGYNDTHVIVNDPYWAPPRREEGHHWAIPIAEFENSIGPVGAGKMGNMPYQALFLDPRAL